MQLGLSGMSFLFPEQFLSVFQNTANCQTLWEGFPPPHTIPSWVGHLAHRILLIPVHFSLCVVIVYLSDIYIRGRKCVLSSVFLGHNTCTSPSISAIWVSDELARASLQKTLLWLWRWKEVYVCLNLVAYQLPHSLDRTSSKVILIKKMRSSFFSWSTHIVISLLPED